MDKQQIEKLILETIGEALAQQEKKPLPTKTLAMPDYLSTGDTVVEEGLVDDLSAVDFRQIISVPQAENPEALAEWRRKTWARIGIWRSGPRYRTESYLRFRVDHAAAMDAVSRDVPEEILKGMNLFCVSTICENKDGYLTHPDWGRMFSVQTMEAIKAQCKSNVEVQLVVADGLSSTAIGANIQDILPSILQGLQQRNMTVGTPIFVKYGRVGAMDAISELVKAQVTVILVGERPGLATSQSMSAYITYGGYVGIPENKRTVISNIHQGGTNAVEAGAFIAELCQRMLQEKASGLDLPL